MDWDALGDELDTIGDITNRAQRVADYRRLLDQVSAGEEGWAEVQMCLADDLLAEGLADDARATYQAALDDGGRTVLDPRAGLLDIALAAEDGAGVDELLTRLMVSSRADELVLGDYEWIAESLEEAGRLREALRWFTIPLRDIQPGDVHLMPALCLNGRWRVRRELGLPLDAYDDAHEVLHSLDDGA